MIKALGGKRWDMQDVQVTPEVLQEARSLGLGPTGNFQLYGATSCL